MTILRDASVIWAMLNIQIFFLIMMEFRFPFRRLLAACTAFFVPICTLNLLYLLRYGPAAMAQHLFVILLLPCVVFYYILSRYRDGRFLYSFFLICDFNADLTILTYLVDVYSGAPRYVVMFVLRLVLFPLLNVIAFRFLRKPYLGVQHNTERGWYGFSLAAALFELLALYLFSYPTMIETRPEALPPLLMVILLTVLINWYIFAALSNQQKLHEAKEKEQLLLLQKIQVEKQAQATARAQSQIAIERHDLRHRFHTLAGILDRGEIAAAKTYLAAADEALSETDPKRWCAHPVFDAVFAYYFSVAESRDIRVESELDVSADVAVDAAELSTVFANALENAIIAVSALPAPERVIRCKCIRYPMLMFQVANPFVGDVILDEDGLPAKPGQQTGTGSRSIAAYCEKHGAWCDYVIADHLFTMRLTQP